MTIDGSNPPNQVTNPSAAIPVRIVGTAPSPVDPANPPNYITIPAGAIPVKVVPKP